MGTWYNNDGLELKYGLDKVKNGLTGEFRYDGPVNCIEIEFDYSRLPTVAQNSVLIGDNYTLPVGAKIERVEIQNFVNFDSAGDAMTLNVGWINTDRTNGVDVDAFVVAATQTELNTGGTNIAGWVGAEVGGVPLTVAKLLTWEVDTAAATAGSGVIRIYFSVAG
jgi:hypothetical protein